MQLTPEQVKGRIKNVAKENKADARTLMRIYMMERFLERVANSQYKDNFIIKGGMLVTAMVGVALRSTMDIDTSIKNQNLSAEDAKRIVDDIKDIDLGDGVTFEVKEVSNIMDEMEYPGIRFTMNAVMGKLVTPMKIDISTGDVITPRAIEYNYKLLLDDRSISLWSYNLETILAEKLQTVLARGLLNTRMRDFYDIKTLLSIYEQDIDADVLKKAFERFEKDEAYDNFIKENAYWLDDYSLYMAIKDSKGGISWNEWEEALKNREEAALENAREELAEEINFYKFQQYEFDKQWSQLHAYANEQGIQIVGDIPIYVAFDGADTWASPELFQFDEENNPVAVAGCPPDDFSATGQLWGNPLYNWEYHKKTEYDWWIKRIRHCLKLYDVVRIDHFRGFDEYYSIPYGNETAIDGAWMPGPGMDLFRALEKNLGKLDVIAEDLGLLTDSVIEMVEESGFPGMKVLQFAFDPNGGSAYLPHNYPENSVVYTGTHDNDTTRGWYHSTDKATRDFAKEYMNAQRLDEDDLAWDFIRLAMSSKANLCVTPMQDLLNLDGKARINVPSTLGGNWTWRMEKGQFDEETVKRLKRMTWLYERLPRELKRK